MKKWMIVLLAVGLLAVGLLAGCGPKYYHETAAAVLESVPVKETGETGTEQAAGEGMSLITVEREEEVGIPEKLTLYRRLPFWYKDAEWTLELYAQGEAGEDGELLFDDSSWFFMKVISDDGEYEFFDEQVSLGIPSADVLTDREGRLHIILKDARTAQYEMTDYLYEEQEGKFTGRKTASYSGINYLGGTSSKTR